MRWKRLTDKEATKLRGERQDAKLKRRRDHLEGQREWHEWFAWRPVFDKDNGFGLWWEPVLRRKQNIAFDGPISRYLMGWIDWSYRPITFLKKDLGMTDT